MTSVILVGDSRSRLRELPDGYAQTCVTSPPYFGLRDYGVDGQIGLEHTPEAFVSELVGVFREVRRVLRDDGTLWLNLGDSYARREGAGGAGKQHSNKGTIGVRRAPVPKGLKNKDLIGIPWRVAFALQADGWILRQDIIWSKPNSMPESVLDRCTKSHEYVFLFSKNLKYYFDNGSIKEPTSDNKALRSKRSVWTVPNRPYKGAHFATFPPDLIEPCILAGAPIGGMVLDPFGGAGTTALVSERLGRESTLIELNPEYAALASERTGAIIIPEGM